MSLRCLLGFHSWTYCAPYIKNTLMRLHYTARHCRRCEAWDVWNTWKGRHGGWRKRCRPLRTYLLLGILKKYSLRESRFWKGLVEPKRKDEP